MKLSELVKPWSIAIHQDCVINALSNDSRNIHSGSCFLAYPGSQTDGRNYIGQAIAAGAVAVLYDAHNWQPDGVDLSAAICIPLPNLAQQLAALASHFYEHIEKELYFVGVTGTNGKTTIALQLAQAYKLLKEKAAYIGTLGAGYPDNLKPLNNTTPDALQLFTEFNSYYQQGISHVCMEVSSHALAQYRVQGIPFVQAIFTNLTRDHLDYHGSMVDYAAAKARLFATPTLKAVLMNADDPYSATMCQVVPKHCQLFTYGFSAQAIIRITQVASSLHGSNGIIESPWGSYPLQITGLGKFNICNALAVWGSLVLSGHGPADVSEILSQLQQPIGRMEVLHAEPTIIVDYAHTPDALANVLQTLLALKSARIILVFGCGGDRDSGKRKIMGQIADQYADHIILTNDNPRHENPLDILYEIRSGITRQEKIEQIPDREMAIKHALQLATAKDIVLIAGKGHELYQYIQDQKIPFSDQSVIKEIYANFS